MGILLLKSLLYGILEGITEWLPISSTGHLILLEEILTLNVGADVHPQFASEFRELFLVAIQLGAVLAVVSTYHSRLFPKIGDTEAAKKTLGLWTRVAVGCIPAGLAGLLADPILERLTGKDMDSLLYNGLVVALALIVYGVLFIVIERVRKGKEQARTEIWQMPLGKALGVGVFQMLSLVPGTSRSGSTILGGMLLGLDRRDAAEFSFFMAIPIMSGACAIKALGFAGFMLQNGLRMPYGAALVLLVAGTVAYLTSRPILKFLIDFSARHGFEPFGVYRILLGIAVLCYHLF